MTLRDALAKFDSEWPIVDVDALNVAVAAARRVAEAPEVWWCEEHDHEGAGSLGYCWRSAWLYPFPRNAAKRCRLVRKLLVDPDNL